MAEQKEREEHSNNVNDEKWRLRDQRAEVCAKLGPRLGPRSWASAATGWCQSSSQIDQSPNHSVITMVCLSYLLSRSSSQ